MTTPLPLVATFVLAVAIAIGPFGGCTGGGGPESLANEDGGCSLAPGASQRTIRAAGFTRRYRVQVGPKVGLAPAPVVFVWHGFGQRAASAEGFLRPARDWPEAIVVTPEGKPRSFEQFGRTRLPGWQVTSGEQGDRDVSFFDAMLAELERAGCVDPERVYSTGFSNGAFFSNLLACVRQEAIAAIAPVGGGGPIYETCDGPVPVLITHGERDRIVPFSTARASLEHWAGQNLCSSQPPASERCISLLGCVDAPVDFCAHAGGHVWPQQATSSVVRFFQANGGDLR